MTIPSDNDNIYTVIYDNNKELHQHFEDDLFDIDTLTLQLLHNLPSTAFPTWIKNTVKANLYLNEMTCSKHRTLVKFKSQWHFKPGTVPTNKLISLPYLERDAMSIHSF